MGIHEYIAHGLKGYSDSKQNHWKAYDDQLRDKTFQLMPEELQKEVKKNRKEYMEREDPVRYEKEYGNQ